VISQLQRNDPNLTFLKIEFVEYGLLRNSTDWPTVGKLIGSNNQINELHIDGRNGQDDGYQNVEESRQFYRDVASSTSIETLHLTGIEEPDVFSPSLLERSANLQSLDIKNCFIGSAGYDALEQLLKNPSSHLKKLCMTGGDLSRGTDSLRDGLANNTVLKQLHVNFYAANHPSLAWTFRNSSIEELCLKETMYGGRSEDTELIEMAPVLKKNTTLKKLTVCLGGDITITGWQALFKSLRNNTTLVELDFSNNNSLDDESMTSFMTVLTHNATLKTLRLENCRNVKRDGWRTIPNLYIKSPTCALESIYLGGNILDSMTFREYGSACYYNRTLKNLCLRLPSSARALNTPRVGWTPWLNCLTKTVYNTRTILQTYSSNHVLETICYPHEEERFARDMMTCPLMGKDVPTYLLRNRNGQDKFALAREKILEAHHYNQEMVAENKKYRNYKSLMETILETTDDMEKTELLSNIMAWVGRDNDGLQLMFELLQRAPTLCESVSSRAHVSGPPIAFVPPAKKMRSE